MSRAPGDRDPPPGSSGAPEPDRSASGDSSVAPATRYTWNGITALVGILCLYALLASAFPGVLHGLLLPAGLLVWLLMPVLLLCGAVLLATRPSLRDRCRVLVPPVAHLAVLLVVTGGTVALLALRAPLRLGFAVSRDAFEHAVGGVGDDRFRDALPGRRLGIHRVDAVRVGPRGDVWFRLCTTGGGPSARTAHGFAWHADRERTPYQAPVRLTPLDADGCVFSVREGS